ncbi:MAG TPA: putative DNA binding domain-containing protein [Victivallales bacterium]|nr:putative DNA binding domain-containing protein [Victivallales bacterium]
MILNTGIDWRSIVYRGFESEELDYKAAQNWLKLNRYGKAKFARHCMALANTNGRYLVVGVGEDKSGKPCIYTGVTEQQSRSFDPTDVGNFINRFADPAIDFEIEKPVIDGKKYVIFVVKRFSLLPHVCCASCNSELQQGFFYIRTADAASRPAYKASEVHELVQRALRNQREHLGRMLRGILYENRKSLEPEAKIQFGEQLQSSEKFFQKLNTENNWGNGIKLQFNIFPPEFIGDKFSLSEIEESVLKSYFNPIDSPFFDPDKADDSYFTNISYRVICRSNKILLQAFSSGFIHYKRLFGKEKSSLSYLELLRFVTDSMMFIGRFYYELGYTDELLSVMFKLSDVENTSLSPDINFSSQKKKTTRSYVCRISEIHVRLQRSAADLMSGTVEHSERVFKEICERFNFSQGQHGNLDETISNYIKNGTFKR